MTKILKQGRRSREKDTEAWKFAKKNLCDIDVYIRPLKKMYKLVNVKALAMSNIFTISHILPVLWERHYKTHVTDKNSREKFLQIQVNKYFSILMDRILMHIIMTGDVFVFPRNRMFLFLAADDPGSSKSKYYIETGSTYVRFRAIMHPRLEKKVKDTKISVNVTRKYRRLIKEMLLKGQTYPYYSDIVNEIKTDYYERRNAFQYKLRLTGSYMGGVDGQIQEEEDRPFAGN